MNGHQTAIVRPILERWLIASDNLLEALWSLWPAEAGVRL